MKKVIVAVSKQQIKESGQDEPEKCGLWLSLLGRRTVLAALYNAGGPAEKRLAQFFRNDLASEEWKLKAVKNGFALLGQKRHELSAAVFIFAGAYKEACDVLVKNLHDPQLALMMVGQNDFFFAYQIYHRNSQRLSLVDSRVNFVFTLFQVRLFYNLDDNDADEDVEGCVAYLSDDGPNIGKWQTCKKSK